MDMNKILKNINTLNEYISASRDAIGQNKNAKVQFNMSSVLALKKIRSYEIEYFNKYEQNGIACIALQYMVDLAPSKSWGVLGKEIVNLIKYWLDAIRKHLISHSPHWWSFLRILLKFLKEVRQKDPSLPNLLVEHTAECLLDLATNEKVVAVQKYEILHCLNMYCADSNREIRFALRNKLGVYFTKLSAYISSCGHFPCQLSVLETLMRWLVPRHDRTLRATSAEKWFPPSMFSREAVDVFLNRLWMDFFQDARDFLNVQNKSSNLILSVICRSLSIGKIVVISGKEKHVSWLDVNSNGKCLSVVLDPQMLETFGATNLKSWETLLISEDNTETVKLDRESHQLTISVTTVRPAHAHPSLINITHEPTRHVKFVVSSKSDLTELDKAMREIFGDKYQEEDTKFSHPVIVKRNRRSGYVVRSRNQCKSPSTTSTTSLAQLHDRLAVLPSYPFDKEPVSVCARPELSIITEVTETDDRHSLHSASTLKFIRSYGVCYRGAKAQKDCSSERNESKEVSRGLSPAVGKKNAPSCLLVATIGSTDDSVINTTMERFANNKDFVEDNIVDLLVKEALEANPEDPIDSGINTDENKKTGQEENCDVIDSSYAEDFANVTRKRGCAVVRETTSDESNTEAISGTPIKNVNTKRKKTLRKKSNEGCLKNAESTVYDAEAVEEFFSQHFAENCVGDVIISPTLAKKINESSSESSEHFDERVIVEIHKNPEIDVDATEVIDCLKCIVDKVCEDFDRYTDPLNIDTELQKNMCDIQEPLKKVMDVQENLRIEDALTPKNVDLKSNRSIKLKYTTPSRIDKTNRKTTASKKRNNITKISQDVEKADKLPQNDESLNSSIINKQSNKKKRINKKAKKNTKSVVNTNNILIDGNIEKENLYQNNDAAENPETVAIKSKPDLNNDDVSDIDTSLIRRKRKLYSPKDDRITNERPPLYNSEADDDIIEAITSKVKAPKSTTTFYKEIEKERKKFTRKSRTKKSKIPEPPSPRTLKMNKVFDKLKETIESNEKITLADKTFNVDVYNFSSDSEEEYFKKKKIVPRKRPSITTMASCESAISTRHGRVTKKINYNENKSSNEESGNQATKRKRIIRKQKRNRQVSTEPVMDLEDQRMRHGSSEVLNTSIIVANPKETTYTEVEPVLQKAPELETIVDDKQSTKEANVKNKSVKRNKKIELSLKKTNTSKTNSIDVPVRDDRTESPLPGLVVESAPVCIEDNNDSVTGTMFQKLKKYYQDGFDGYVNETNTTQNLLSDMERVNYSPYKARASENRVDIQKEKSFDRSEVVRIKTEIAQDQKKKTSAKHKAANSRLFNKTKNVENVANMSGTLDDKSDISVTSQGITAHGDIEEDPPSAAMIEEQVQPRNLELEYLDRPLQDYYDILRNKINWGNNGSHGKVNDCYDNGDEQANSHKDGSTIGEKSPKVAMARLSSEEIDKWISSGKSDSIKNTSSAKEGKKFTNEKEKSPVVSVSRLSAAEMEKWLPSCNNSVSEQENTNMQQKCKENKTLQSLYEIHKWYPSRRNSSSDVESVQDNQNEANKSFIKLIFKGREPINVTADLSNDVTRSQRSKHEESIRKDSSRTKSEISKRNVKKANNENDDTNDKNIRTTIKYNTFNESKSRIEQSDSTRKHNSVISPVKIGNFFSQTIKPSTHSDDDECVKRVRNIFAESERNVSTKRKTVESHSHNHLDVLSSPNSTSTKINSSTATKRKSVSLAPETKKPKIDVVHVANEDSVPSTSSVNDWFRKNVPSCSRDEIFQLSIIDCVQNVVEKLDTTLVDINQHTSKKLIHMFVDAQKQLDEHRERRHAMYKQAASEMLAQIVQIMDEKFSDLDKRSQEMDNTFMEKLRSHASEVILEDSNRKQAMVQILKQDVEAVAEYVKNKL
ncbi:uncharacterized protein LOC115442994 isoform X1 [Manduca sexta]|uniref:uncharacterized protein LOC115442994 isoform X1 n=1 Tax=Manduca sexta TaxID=7130 RepID=UPI00188F40BD|nr:uncharacterized protein LOC115442994 isoform X1 [Manduca sexta]